MSETIQIDAKKSKALNAIASVEGKTIQRIISELIDKYLEENRNKIKDLSENKNLKETMKISEESFAEWNNVDDEIYNDL